MLKKLVLTVAILSVVLVGIIYGIISFVGDGIRVETMANRDSDTQVQQQPSVVEPPMVTPEPEPEPELDTEPEVTEINEITMDLPELLAAFNDAIELLNNTYRVHLDSTGVLTAYSQHGNRQDARRYFDTTTIRVGIGNETRTMEFHDYRDRGSAWDNTNAFRNRFERNGIRYTTNIVGHLDGRDTISPDAWTVGVRHVIEPSLNIYIGAQFRPTLLDISEILYHDITTIEPDGTIAGGFLLNNSQRNRPFSFSDETYIRRERQRLALASGGTSGNGDIVIRFVINSDGMFESFRVVYEFRDIEGPASRTRWHFIVDTVVLHHGPEDLSQVLAESRPYLDFEWPTYLDNFEWYDEDLED